jgi:hypothetical protein
MLQADWSPIRFPMRSLNFFFNLRNPSSRTMPLGLNQPLNRNVYQESSWGNKGHSECKADNLAAICEQSV